MEDFTFLTSCDEIISSVSSFSFWAAFLSNAKQVFHPIIDEINFSKTSFVDDEDRYVRVEV